jgi:hypothetical protein
MPSGSRSSGVIYHHGIPHPLQPGDWDLQYTLEQGRPTTFRLSLTPPTPLTLHCQGETLTAIPVVRHASQGSALAVTFGLSHTRWQGREARGVYEFSERLKNSQETTYLSRSGKSDIADHLSGLAERGQGLAVKG